MTLFSNRILKNKKTAEKTPRPKGTRIFTYVSYTGSFFILKIILKIGAKKRGLLMTTIFMRASLPACGHTNSSYFLRPHLAPHMISKIPDAMTTHFREKHKERTIPAPKAIAISASRFGSHFMVVSPFRVGSWFPIYY